MIRVLGPGEWELLRDLRLRALSDSPEAFAQPLKHAEALTVPEWQERVSASDNRTWLIDEATGSAAIGMAAAFVHPDESGVVVLGAMFVDPEHRGRGVARRLVDAVERWAVEKGASTVVLDVNPAMRPARLLYEQCGYTPTGKSSPLPTAPDGVAVELSKQLG